MAWQQLTDEQCELVRQQVCARTKLFLRALGELLPRGVITLHKPEGRQLAATLFVSLETNRDTKPLGFADYGKKIVVAHISDDEKVAVGEAVANASYQAGLEALLKPTACTADCLVYKVFYRINGS